MSIIGVIVKVKQKNNTYFTLLFMKDEKDVEEYVETTPVLNKEKTSKV